MMKFFRLSSGVPFTTALEIENHAAAQGFTPRVDPDGTRHPGSVVNRYLKEIMSNSVLMKTLGIKQSDYFQIDVTSSKGNAEFVRWMIDNNYIRPQSVKNNCLDVYSIKAAHAILSVMLGEKVKFPVLLNDLKYIPNIYNVKLSPKKLDKKNHTGVKSLISPKKENYRVIDLFSSNDQDTIRLYNRLVKETREKGRVYYKRGGNKL